MYKKNRHVTSDKWSASGKSNMRNFTVPFLTLFFIMGLSLLGGFTILPAMADNSDIIFTDSNSTSAPSTSDSTSVTISSNLSTANPGSSVTLTVTVSDTSSSPTAPTGAVSWSDNNAGGAFNPSSCILASGSCTTSYTIATNSPSTVPITASYGGDSIHTTSSGTSTLTINHLNPTSTAITPSSAVLPSNRTLTFTVQTSDTSSSPTTLSGAVSFNDNNNGGTFNPTSCTLPSATCVTTYTSPANPLNVITINATYSGDSTHLGSSAVSKISTSPVSTNKTDATTMAITSNSTTFTPGSPIIVTASVTDPSNPSSSMIGIISWSDNGAGGIFSPNLCLLSNNKCALTYTPSTSASGGITITATYAGDSTHSGNSGTLSISSSVQSSTPTPAPSTPSSPSSSSSTPQQSSTPSAEQTTPPASSQSSVPSSSSSTSTTPSTPSSTQSSSSTPSPVPSTQSVTSSTPPTSPAKSATQSSPSTSTSSSESSNTASSSSSQQQTSSAAVVHQVVNVPEEIFSKAISILEGFFHKL